MVLTYTNDAIQEMPANRPFRCSSGGVGVGNGEVTLGAPATPTAPIFPERPEGQHSKEPEGEEAREQCLWVAALDVRKGKKIWHKVTKAGWQISLASWSKPCGWNFTMEAPRKSDGVSCSDFHSIKLDAESVQRS